MTDISTIANIAAIFTALIAAYGYGSYRIDRYLKDSRLVEYLKSEKNVKEDKGQRSLLHLMANVGMTEAEILQASFRSKHIKRKLAKDNKSGRAEAILLEWEG